MNNTGKTLIEDFRWIARAKTVGPTNITYAFTPEMLEKFAELIIEKCAEIADDNYDSGFCPTGDFIKKHFGVE